jgi:molybdate-binding protein/DNA-binding XRE family transcriptional regulator
VINRLAAIRQSRGIAAAELAAQVGVKRQTIYAIEGGAYLPNTEVALRLADTLDVPVGELFSLEETTLRPPAVTALAGSRSAPPGTSVHVCRVGEGWVSIPVSAAPYHLPVGDAFVDRQARSSGRPRITLVNRLRDAEDRLVLAGCDPAALLLAQLVERESSVRVVPAPAASRAAIRMVCDNTAHLAGSHLEDSVTGEFNLSLVRENAALDGATIYTMAQWESGLVVAPGNPLRLRTVEDLTRRGVTFINREPGSGSRALLEKLMQRAGVAGSAIRGFDRVAGGHLAAAYRVASGDADVCLATRSAARSFNLGFVTLQAERYDFVVPRAHRDLPVLRTFLDVIQSARVRRKFAALTCYDTRQMGRQVA